MVRRTIVALWLVATILLSVFQPNFFAAGAASGIAGHVGSAACEAQAG
ncbi:hypothetical protein [Paenibacillus sp. N3.4]|nr:hypothetical protein [Paenibacillus sp. N3.4]